MRNGDADAVTERGAMRPPSSGVEIVGITRD
jgi:hypothetical protein